MNIAQAFTNTCKLHANEHALTFYKLQKKWPWSKGKLNYRHQTFKELDILSSKLAMAYTNHGIENRMRVIIFLKPANYFHATIWALFKIGAIPVFIDPGMGMSQLLNAIQETEAEALIAEWPILFLRFFLKKRFKNIRLYFSTKKIWFFKNTHSISELKKHKLQVTKIAPLENHDEAAILFTSGGTGTPKGVIYNHGIFNQQIKLLKESFHLSSSDIDLPGFPLFSLFTNALGINSIVSVINPSRPAKVNPELLYKQINDLQPSLISGSPAIWSALAEYLQKEKKTLPSVRVLAMFGAPVSSNLISKYQTFLPNGDTTTPYGATEALPVSLIWGSSILNQTAHYTDEGHGVCIGHAIAPNKVKIIRLIPDSAHIKKLTAEDELPDGSIGEIIVQGPIVTPAYWKNEAVNKNSKIKDGNLFWHRMGDIGFIDAEKRIWFLGRKSHAVQINQTEILYPMSVESIFKKHPEVKNAALVGIGHAENEYKIPAICILRKDGRFLHQKERAIFENELLALAQRYQSTKPIQKIYLAKNFPVDVRHNIKIDRIKLAVEIESFR